MSKGGSVYERAVRDGFRALGDETADRNLDQVRYGGADILTRFPFTVECKDRKMGSPWAALTQAEAAVTDGRTPVAFLRKKNGRGRPAEELVAMRPEHYFELLAALTAYGHYDEYLK